MRENTGLRNDISSGFFQNIFNRQICHFLNPENDVLPALCYFL